MGGPGRQGLVGHASCLRETSRGWRRSITSSQAASIFPLGCTWQWSRSTPPPATSTCSRCDAVDDAGVIVNPMLAAGQRHGGLAQGIGQAMWEEVRYDPDGNLLTASMVDYLLPTAGRTPGSGWVETCTPSPTNPSGGQGCRRGRHPWLHPSGCQRRDRRPLTSRGDRPPDPASGGKGVAGDPTGAKARSVEGQLPPRWGEARAERAEGVTPRAADHPPPTPPFRGGEPNREKTTLRRGQAPLRFR